MQENLKFERRKKFFACVLLAIFMLALFCSFLCAIILPVTNVASAGYVPSDSSNTQYTFYGFDQDFSTDNMGLYYNLSYDCTGDTYDLFNNMIAWRGDNTVWTGSTGNKYRVSVFGYLYGYLYDVKMSAVSDPIPQTSYVKECYPFGLMAVYDSSDNLSYCYLGCLNFNVSQLDNPPFTVIYFLSTRYRQTLSSSADMRVAFNSTIKYEGSYYLAPSSLSHFNNFYNYPIIQRQIATGISDRPWYFAPAGYCLLSSSVPNDFPMYASIAHGIPSGVTRDSYMQITTFLSNCMSFGYRVSVSDSSGDFYNLGYNNGYLDAKEGFEEEKTSIYNSGFESGKTAGYNDGYNAGKDASDNYTFLGLIGAVFDAPIEAFKGLFNFEILGTNMQGFVLALLTLSVIIVIIKIALGGK